MMAVYDIEQDKIFGCKKKGLVWWHEKGHQNLRRLGIGAEINTLDTFALLFSVFFLIYDKIKLAKISFFILIGSIIIEEIYCWIYAFRKRERKK